MSDLIETVVEKVSAYNLFNYFVPGAVFTAAIHATTGCTLLSGNLVVDITVMYFSGLVISRIGSLVIEPVCKHTHFLTYSAHADFISAERKDSKLTALLQENNTYRTMTALFLSVLLFKAVIVVQAKVPALDRLMPWALPVALLILFVLSYRKQTKYIVKRINAAKVGGGRGVVIVH